MEIEIGQSEISARTDRTARGEISVDRDCDVRPLMYYLPDFKCVKRKREREGK